MGTYKQNRMGIQEQRAWEDMLATVEQQQADLDYIAMMADVDLEDEEETTEDTTEDTEDTTEDTEDTTEDTADESSSEEA